MMMMVMMVSLCKTECQIKPCKCLLRRGLAYSAAPGAPYYNKDMTTTTMILVMENYIMMTMMSFKVVWQSALNKMSFENVRESQDRVQNQFPICLENDA